MTIEEKESMKELIIQGEPIAMMRPRVARGRAYNPQAELKKRCQMEVKALWNGPPLLCPVKLVVQFFLRRDNKDLDNMIKWVGDILQGIVFKNDLQVEQIWAKKIKGKETKTVIYVEGGI